MRDIDRTLQRIEVVNTGRLSGGRPILRLLRPLIYSPGCDENDVVIPAGFETDCSSVPRLLWRVAAPWDAIEPGVIHDYLYRRRAQCPRAKADRTYRVAMRDYGVVWWRRELMYLAVRVFGWAAYQKRD
jgi:hypothetical protein